MNFWTHSGWEQLYKVIGAVVFWGAVIRFAFFILGIE